MPVAKKQSRSGVQKPGTTKPKLKLVAGGKDPLRKRVEALSWVHSIDLGNGFKTRGTWGEHTKGIWKALSQISFKGKTVLDIGCWDGLWSFEAEKRGASQVFATDEVSQRTLQKEPTFLLAKKILGSKAKYDPHVSVYDLKNKFPADSMDVVLFTGIYYHLRYPMLALSQLRSVMKEGGYLVIEGPVIHKPGTHAEFYYRKAFSAQDPSNWWVPTPACLREWVESSYFEVVDEWSEYKAPAPTLWNRFKRRINQLLGRSLPPPYSRYTILAKAVVRKDPKYLFPDPYLEKFNR